MFGFFELLEHLFPVLLRGMRVTIQLTLVSATLALFVAFLAGLARLSKYAVLRAVAGFYIELFRGTSALVQLFWFFFALPFLGVELSPFLAGVLALGLNLGAYGSEVVRGAILSIPRGQVEAAIALNMSTWQRMRFVILPQAVVRMLPPFGNQIIELLKLTALVSLVTLPDLTFQGYMFVKTAGHTTAVYTLLLVSYFLIAYPLTAIVRSLERRARWVGYGGA